MKPEIGVTQGRFRLSTVNVIYATQSLLVIEAGCNSKYPGGISIAWGGDQGARVEIWPEEGRSLYLDETTQKPSTITLPDYTGEWTVLTDARRYTVRIVAYQNQTPRPIWRDH